MWRRWWWSWKKLCSKVPPKWAHRSTSCPPTPRRSRHSSGCKLARIESRGGWPRGCREPFRYYHQKICNYKRINSNLKIFSVLRIRDKFVTKWGLIQISWYFQCCESGMFNPDPGLTRFWIRIRIKEFKYKINWYWVLKNKIRDVHPGSWIWIFLIPDPNPGVKKHRIPDPQHW